MTKKVLANVRRSARLCAGLLLAPLVGARADSTVSAANHFAYGANIGWIEARGDVAHGAVLGQSYCSGYLWGANVGWIGLGSGPTNGWAYTNASAADWGVNHDGAGGLTGFAYGANIGWVTFEQAHGRPRIDLLSGTLSGSVWGANVGWISLSNAFARVQTDTLSAGADTDADGIPDAWELRRTGGLSALGARPADADGDGVPDLDEYAADTDPRSGSDRLAITGFDKAGLTGFVTWPTVPTRHYRLLEAASLAGGSGWSDSGYGLLVSGGAPTLTRAMTSTNPAAFYRVQAIVPLAP
jgi:hypothetical protein